MKKQIEYNHLFRNLHVKGDPLILFNIWDVASAKNVANAGAKAIATSSWSVAYTSETAYYSQVYPTVIARKRVTGL
jgi:2-methylisocitrate lyase-like PEP mutase family enzyme